MTVALTLTLADCVDVANRARRVAAGLGDRDDVALRADLGSLRGRSAGGEPLTGLLVEALAIGAEAHRRSLGTSPCEVDLCSAAAVSLGCVAELPAGEGSSAGVILAALCCALDGRGVHVATLTDEQAVRDSWRMTVACGRLGLEVGLLRDLPTHDRKTAYLADVTYGSYSQFAYDYLRDHLHTDMGQVVQRGLAAALVQDIDLMLIDRSLIPLVIGTTKPVRVPGPDAEHLAARLRRDDHYRLDESSGLVLTRDGLAAVWEQAADGSYDAQPAAVLGAAVERVLAVREGLGDVGETVLASIDVGDYFRMYERLGGFAVAGASIGEELHDGYGVSSVEIAPGRPEPGVWQPDLIFETDSARLAGLASRVERAFTAGRPVIVDVQDRRSADALCEALTDRSIVWQRPDVGQYLAGAGRPGVVTIVDCRDLPVTALPDPEPTDQAKDGLGQVVLGCGYGTSRRGRARLRGLARQGGELRFLLSRDDALLVGTDSWVARAARRLAKGGSPSVVDRSPSGRLYRSIIDSRDDAVETTAAARRKRLRAFASVADRMRRAVYELRRSIMRSDDVTDHVHRLIDEVQELAGGGGEGLRSFLVSVSATGETVGSDAAERGGDGSQAPSMAVRKRYHRRERELGATAMRELERQIALTIVDLTWRDCLVGLDFLHRYAGTRHHQDGGPLVQYEQDAKVLLTAACRSGRLRFLYHLLTARS